MGDMRKFQHQLTIRGRNGTGALTYSYLPYQSTGACKQFPVVAHPGKAFLDGLQAITIFPELGDIMSRFEPDGLRADWINVGRDVRKSMDKLAADQRTVTGAGDSKNDRDAA